MKKKDSTEQMIVDSSFEEKLKIEPEESSYAINNIDIRDSSDFRQDWNVLNAYEEGYLSSEESDYPESRDLSKFIDSWEVHRQKEGEYSCIGYAITDMHYWHLCYDLGYQGEKLSARFNWIAAKEIDEFSARPTTFITKAGSTLKAGLKVSLKYGAVKESILITEEGKEKSFDGTPQQFYNLASKYRISSYYNLLVSIKYNEEKEDVKRRRDGQVKIWKKWLYEVGPILIRIKTDYNWNQCKREVLSEYSDRNQGKKHAALIVGYNSKGFIIRNSWGTTWGNNGYSTVSIDYALDAFDEAFGMIVKGNEVGDDPASSISRPPISWLDWLFN